MRPISCPGPKETTEVVASEAGTAGVGPAAAGTDGGRGRHRPAAPAGGEGEPTPRPPPGQCRCGRRTVHGQGSRTIGLDSPPQGTAQGAEGARVQGHDGDQGEAGEEGDREGQEGTPVAPAAAPGTGRGRGVALRGPGGRAAPARAAIPRTVTASGGGSAPRRDGSAPTGRRVLRLAAPAILATPAVLAHTTLSGGRAPCSTQRPPPRRSGPPAPGRAPRRAVGRPSRGMRHPAQIAGAAEVPRSGARPRA
jgi:hypothetical protein